MITSLCLKLKHLYLHVKDYSMHHLYTVSLLYSTVIGSLNISYWSVYTHSVAQVCVLLRAMPITDQAFWNDATSFNTYTCILTQVKQTYKYI